MAYTEPLQTRGQQRQSHSFTAPGSWFAGHRITHIEKIITDNGACCRADVFTRSLLRPKHKRVKPYTSKHNSKVERYNRILRRSSFGRVHGTAKLNDPRP